MKKNTAASLARDNDPDVKGKSAASKGIVKTKARNDQRTAAGILFARLPTVKTLPGKTSW